MNPLSTATEGKGIWNMIKRTTVIGRRYGLTARNMDHTLANFAATLEAFHGKATFPITGAALARNGTLAAKYQTDRVEFAAHGYYHVDHTQLSLDEQCAQLTAVRRLFADHGLAANGFRCPYLRWTPDTLTAVREAGFLYDSSQALVWQTQTGITSEAYERVLGFYGALPAADHPALPRLENGLVRIPYCLPDDEALIDRLPFADPRTMHAIWPDILDRTHRLGELFTLGLHPERLAACKPALAATLQRAKGLTPAVWCARLDEIARWWKARTATAVTISRDAHDQIHLHIDGPEGVTVLSRHLDLSASTEPWDDAYRRVLAHTFSIQGELRPFIGVSPASAPYLTSFLRQQGYIVEPARSDESHALFIDSPTFDDADERPLLAHIERADFPLIRLGRWPAGARSALCITGDIDALTIWDYGLRFLGS